eukprot:Rhum_TRINITY_DN13524_c0_g1::Rhum_TRINITY_DN13524_c0_g1_i1::g.60896::m.60896/K19384/TMEM17; transmembrane protein 17
MRAEVTDSASLTLNRGGRHAGGMYSGVRRSKRFADVFRSHGTRPWGEGVGGETGYDTGLRAGEVGGATRCRHRIYGKSLVLQMLLYYNVVYSIAFCGVAWAAYFHKVKLYSVAWKHQMWYAVVMLLWTAFECLRLSFGYIGNFRSSVQHLIGFFIFTICNVALVLVFYAVDKGLPRNSHDRALSTVHLLFIIAELFFAVFETKRQIRYHTVRYYLSLGDGDAGASGAVDMP